MLLNTEASVQEIKGLAPCGGEEKNKPQAPLHFWQIDNFFKCPVVGMCLTLAEQKRLLRKNGFTIKKKSPFDLHETLVASAESDNLLSRKVDHLLNRKFGKEAAGFIDMDPEAFKKLFMKAFEEGDCVAITWAAAAKPDLPFKLKKEIFGEIHMAMHWSGEQSIKLKKRLSMQKKEAGEMRRSISEAAKLRCSLRKESKRFQQDLDQMKTALAIAQKKNKGLEKQLAELNMQQCFRDLERENRALKEKIKIRLEQSQAHKRQNDLLREENRRLTSELERQKKSGQRFQTEIRELMGEFCAMNRCDATCPSFDLCRKRILIVGGITRMESLYRELIENSGGVFDYHDGYMKKGAQKLEQRLKRADLVVCPVNCNSHAACSIVKNLAKKHDKTVHMLASSSLSAVSKAIRGVNDQSVLN